MQEGEKSKFDFHKPFDQLTADELEYKQAKLREALNSISAQIGDSIQILPREIRLPSSEKQEYFDNLTTELLSPIKISEKNVN